MMAPPEARLSRAAGTPPAAAPPQAPHAAMTRRVRLELIILGIALFCGFVLVPLAIWLVGNRILGPYTHGQDASNGGPMRLLGDFFGGLGHGSVIFWCVVVGPYVILSLGRLLYLFIRWAPAISTSRN
jgi:hypothetical protein